MSSCSLGEQTIMVTRNMRMYLKQFDVTPLNVCCYLIGCEKTKEAVVIDPAAEGEMIVRQAEADGFRIAKIINTHGHIDHIMGNDEMKARTNASLVVHEGDAKAISDIPFYKLLMFNAKASPPPDMVVKDGDLIAFGEQALRIIHTPGHSPGSMCLALDGYVFTGDTLFVHGVGRTDLPGGSWPELLKSIKEKIFTLPDTTIILPGHNYGPRPTSTIKDEKLYNPFLRGN